MAIPAKFEYIEGHNYGATVYGKTEGGKTVQVYLPAKVIEEISKYIDRNHGQAGHAIWHYHNPDYEYPCTMCNPESQA